MKDRIDGQRPTVENDLPLTLESRGGANDLLLTWNPIIGRMIQPLPIFIFIFYIKKQKQKGHLRTCRLFFAHKVIDL